jgi:hypothetical protein
MNKKIAFIAFGVTCSALSFGIFPDVAAPEFTWVGMIGTASNNMAGSGTAITPFNVITAKHVPGLFYNLPGFGSFQAISRVEHPTADLAILRFGSALPGFYNPMFADQIGQTVTMVGFGDTGTLRGDGTGYISTGGAGTRRKGNQRVSDRQAVNLGGNITNSVSLLYDLDGNGVDFFQDGGPVAGEAGLNFGDSGGAWLRNVGGTNFIVGVNSFIFDSNNNNNLYDFGDGGGAVDLNNYSQWVLTNTVPEPATMAALGAGLAVLLRRRKK